MLFKIQSYNPVSHVVINTNTTAIVFRTEELWRGIAICDLLNQVELCNKRIAMLGALAMPKHQWEFVTAYYRITRGQAVNAAAVLGGSFPIKYCQTCLSNDSREVQAVHRIEMKHTQHHFCDHHNKEHGLPTERIW